MMIDVILICTLTLFLLLLDIICVTLHCFCPLLQMDYIAGSFYDGFVLYAMALEETLAEGGAQNDGISITMKMQNRHMWGEQNSGMSRASSLYQGGFYRFRRMVVCDPIRKSFKGFLTAMAAWEPLSAVNMQGNLMIPN